jgi:hypothetical protein
MRGKVAIAIPALVLALALAGCTSGRAAVAPPAPAASAMQLVAHAVPSAAHGSYRFTEKGPAATATGAADPARKTFQVTVDTPVATGVAVRIELLGVNPQVWAKTSVPGAGKDVLDRLPKVPDTWMRLDRAKLGDSADEVFRFTTADLTDLSALLEGLVSAQRTPAGGYQGVIDLTKASNQTTVDVDTVQTLAGKAKAMPFTMTLDDRQRVLSFTMPIPAAGEAPASTYTATFAGYGSTPAPPAPAQSVDAPPAEYQYFNGDFSGGE